MQAFLSYLIPGILVGFIYALIALGFVLIYKASGVLNMATGQFVIFGAYVAWTVTVPWGLPWWVAFVAVIVGETLLALVIERGVLRPLMGQPVLGMIMATLGLGIILDGLITFTWGNDWRALPRLFPGQALEFRGIRVSVEFLWIGGLAIAMVGVLAAFFKYTKLGLTMRATADDHLSAASIGVSFRKNLRYSWIISAIVCGVSGVLLTLITNIHYTLTSMGLKAIAVVLAGGLESLLGVVVAGPLIGATEYTAAGYLDPLVGGGITDVVAFAVLVLFIMFKPFGLFGWKSIDRV